MTTYYLDTKSTAPTSGGTYLAPFKTIAELLSVISPGDKCYSSGRSIITDGLFNTGGAHGYDNVEFYGDWVPGTVNDRYNDNQNNHRTKVFTAKLSTYDWNHESGDIYSTSFSGLDIYIPQLLGMLFDIVGNPLPCTGIWVDNDDGTYTPIVCIAPSDTPDIFQFCLNELRSKTLINLNGINPNDVNLLIFDAAPAFANPTSFQSLENTESTKFEGFEVWFGLNAIGNTGCAGSSYKNIGIFYPTFDGIYNLGFNDFSNIYILKPGANGYESKSGTINGSENIIINGANGNGIFLYYKDSDLSNDTKLFNVIVFGSKGRGVYLDLHNNRPVEVRNIISYGNLGGDFYANDASVLTASNNCSGDGNWGGDWNAHKGLNNAIGDPKFVNASGTFSLPSDFQLGALTPDAIAKGGFDLSTIFTKDYDGVDRTVPWSMGAFEYDKPLGGGGMGLGLGLSGGNFNPNMRH